MLRFTGLPAVFFVRCGLLLTLLVGSAAVGPTRPAFSVATTVARASAELALAWKHLLALATGAEYA